MEITSSQITYQGLNRKLCKNVYPIDNIKKLDKIYHKSNGIVGNIPSMWVKNMPKENREQSVKQLYAEMGTFCSKILPIFKDSKISNIILTKILQKNGAIDRDAQIIIQKSGKGDLANGYKIENTKDGTSLFLKKFKNTKNSRCLVNTGLHGKDVESNVKTYLKHDLKTNEEKKHFSKFYYGDIHNGYYIEEYLPDSYINEDSLLGGLTKICSTKIHTILDKHYLHHNDLHQGNIRYYFDKNEKMYAVCFDLGGTEKNYTPFFKYI